MKPLSSITLNKLKLTVHLGWPDAEQVHEQIILVDVIIHFHTLPAACQSDQLAETYCYDQLIHHIKEVATAKVYRLIEHLGYEIYQAIKRMVTTSAHIQVNLLKHPAIPDLTGGVTFSIGDTA